jgi:hypothetical protein
MSNWHHCKFDLAKLCWHTPKLLDRLNCESKCENNKRIRSWGTLPGSQHFGGVKGHARALRWGLERVTSIQLLTWTCTNQITSWLVHSWNIFGARTSHTQTWTHKTHHGPDLGEATTFPLILFFVHDHETSTQMSFCIGTPKWESQNSRNWDSYDFGGP